MTQLEKVLYIGKTRTSGGRDGTSRSSDGRLDVRLSSPGTPGTGTNPEQLLAAAWSACFISTIKHVAEKMKVTLPASVAMDAEVDLATTGLRPEAARALVDAARLACPFFNATRDNVDVAVNLL